MPIYFYSNTDKYGEFSNFSPHGFELDGAWWPTVEHYFQAQKFEDEAYRERIRTAKTPKYTKTLGRTRALPIRADWDTKRDEVMLLAVRRKFQTHAPLRELLLSTGDEPLVENAPGDYYWGCGKDGSGANKLGRLLEQVREELRNAKIASPDV